MEKPTCGIIQDLLISYSDGLTGENVTGMIQEHLAECPKCLQQYENVKKQQEIAESQELSRGKSFGEKLESIRYYMIGICIGLVAPVAFILVWFLINSIGSYIETMLYSHFS